VNEGLVKFGYILERKVEKVLESYLHVGGMLITYCLNRVT
jgi:hypothetical protein